jgi:hypothetical protein
MPDYFARVPKTLRENLAYRVRLRERARQDEKFRRAMMKVCKEDFLAFLAMFAWGYDPRPQPGKPKWTPFIPREHQIEPLRLMRKHLGYKDILGKKSRDEGFSWMMVYLAVHDFLFDPGSKIGIVSRSEDEADDPDNSDSIGWKLDRALERLPPWMTGQPGKDWTRNKSKHAWVNKRNGSSINADAATGNVFRGGRLKWAAMDEFAFFNPGEDGHAQSASSGATNSRLFISTVNGTGNEFHRIDVEPSNVLRITIHWSQNPVKNRGLYEFRDGRPVALDPANPLPKEYDPPSAAVQAVYKELRDRGFKLEGRRRSPWYDEYCHRPGMTPQRVAQELDHDYGGSMQRVFLAEFFEAANKTVRPPLHRGRLSYNPETLEPDFEPDPTGGCLLWCPLDMQKRPPPHQYAIGADVSDGGGGDFTSNSVVEVLDLLTQEQVFQFATNSIEPPDFADLCVALAKWFWDAELGWEHNGPGTSFTKRIKQTGYGRLYRREIHHKQSKKVTSDIGWWTSPATKEFMFGDLSRAVRTKDLILRSAETVRECGEYIRDRLGKIQHVAHVRNDGQVHGGLAHGDRVIASCVALQVAKRRSRQPLAKVAEQNLARNPPPGTMAHRFKELEEAEARAKDDWDNRSNWDLQRGANDLRPTEHWSDTQFGIPGGLAP